MKTAKLVASWTLAASGALVLAAAMETSTFGLFAQSSLEDGLFNRQVTDVLGYQCPGPAMPEPAMGQLNLSAPPAGINIALSDAPDPPMAYGQYDLKTGMRYSYGFASADFNCDGKPDISMFDSYSGSRRLLDPRVGAIGYIKWNGGDVEEITTVDGYPELGRPNNVVLFERHIALDVNSDGFTDIVGVVNSHGSVVAYLNPGAPGTKWQRVYVSQATPGPINITSGDIDGDGLPDIVVSMRNQPSTDPAPAVRGIVWLRNPGGPGAWAQNPVNDSAGLNDPRTLAVADVNKDGRQDIIASDNAGTLAWWENKGGAWEYRIIPGVLTAHGHFGGVYDFDKDGFPDILQPTYQGVQIVRNIDGGTNWQVIPVALFASEPRQIVVSSAIAADVDLDGLTDIIVTISTNNITATGRSRGGAYLLRQTASSWAPSVLYTEDSSTVGASVLDYDLDGDQDLILNSEYQRNGVSLFLNLTK